MEQRQRFGDFECDLIIGAGHSGVILTVNDRVSGLLWMEKLKDKQATTVSKALIRLLKPLKGKIHTLTSDNGTEFVLHEEVSKQLECQCFFAKPYHSWERGSNKNLNGLIRDYFPKKIEFYDITAKQIKETQEALNNRPRKRHNFLTPNEFNQQELKNKLTPVALAIRILPPITQKPLTLNYATCLLERANPRTQIFTFSERITMIHSVIHITTQ